MWDGEIASMKWGIEMINGGMEIDSKKVLIVTDSQAAIKEARKAGMMEKARTSDLKRLIDLIAERNSRTGGKNMCVLDGLSHT